MEFTIKDEKKLEAVIKVIGVGGAGGNAINNMIENNLKNVEFIAANTDFQALSNVKAPLQLLLGEKVTKGLGSGGDPRLGEKAAIDDREKIRQFLEGADMVFITAGMGGGTGTGASPVIASIAKELDALVVGIVTMPFRYEGIPRRRKAQEGLAKLREVADAMIVISNDKLSTFFGKGMKFRDVFRKADEVLYLAVRGILDIIETKGYINVDFNDVRSVLTNAGEVIMGTGVTSGEDRIKRALDFALSNPLVENPQIDNPSKVLVNIIFPEDTFTFDEFEDTMKYVQEYFGEKTEVLPGVGESKDLKPDEIRITIIGAGSKRKVGEDSTTEETAPKLHYTVDETGTSIFQTGDYSDEIGTRSETRREKVDDFEIPTILRRQMHKNMLYDKE